MQKYRTEKFLIAGGNPTLLVWGISNNLKNQVIKDNLNKVDQIGFISNKGLAMMGGELCINATLAYASTLDQSGFLNIAALKKPIKYKNTSNGTTLTLPLIIKKSPSIILLEGIGFKFENEDYKITKAELKGLCIEFNLPAFGIILFAKNRITPFVYVAKTNSLKQESSCGSGSIAASLMTGFSSIEQPTGQITNINFLNGLTEITSKITKQQKGGVYFGSKYTGNFSIKNG